MGKIFLVVAMLFPLVVFSKDNFFEVGTGYLYQKNNLAVDSSNKRIDDYSSHDGFSKVIPIIRFNYNITNSLYIKSQDFQSPEGAFRLGYKKDKVLNSEVDFYLMSAIPTKVWENPYLLHADRHHTYQYSYGGGMDVSDILGSDYSYNINVMYDNVHNDEIGHMYDDLKRDGARINQVIYREFDFSQDMMLNFGVGVERGAYEGDANAYWRYFLQGNFYYQFHQDYSTNFMYSVGYSKFDDKHPIFNKTREDVDWNFILALKKDNLMGYKNIFGSVYTGGGGSRSNISFFKRVYGIVGVSVGYSF